ncbi:hypothetical protein [Corynebacterium sp. Marseille-P4321]|uniref:hypothetical protein n=1 Tax=Corynebacterium sp. Marseille-P4321 TaxID=2736603 RepID=UPI00158C6498|nr:hypothetical protein [Corynebacterium sp. Marseille-P4321]
MVDSQLAKILNDKYALSNGSEKASTDISTLYTATNTWGTSTVEVEYFNDPVPEAAAEELANVAGSLGWLENNAVFTVRDCGLTEDSRLYVLREEPQGTPLRSLIDGRATWGTPFSNQEAEQLLGPVAQAIDHYNSAGRANFLSRSIDTDHLLVQQGGPVPLKLSLVGPTAGAGLASENKNRRAFAEILAEMTGAEVDEEALENTNSATDYLLSVVRPPAPQAPPAAAPTPEPQYWEPQPEPAPQPEPETESILPPPPPEPEVPRPQQYFPDTDPGMEPVGGTAQYGYADYQQPYQEPQKKRKAWPWVLAGVLLLGGAGAGGYWWYTQNPQTEPWTGVNAEIAEQFPDIVSDEAEGTGFQGLTCHAGEVAGDEKGKVRCADADAGVSIVKYENVEARDKAIPGLEKAEHFGSESCQIRSVKMEGQDLPAYYVAPEGEELGVYSFLVNGNDAEQMRLRLPIC